MNSNLTHNLTIGGITVGPLGGGEDGCPLTAKVLHTRASYPYTLVADFVSYHCFIPLFYIPLFYIPLFYIPLLRSLFHTIVPYPLWGGGLHGCVPSGGRQRRRRRGGRRERRGAAGQPSTKGAKGRTSRFTFSGAALGAAPLGWPCLAPPFFSFLCLNFGQVGNRC